MNVENNIYHTNARTCPAYRMGQPLGLLHGGRMTN